jgi:hypothetical protein
MSPTETPDVIDILTADHREVRALLQEIRTRKRGEIWRTS